MLEWSIIIIVAIIVALLVLYYDGIYYFFVSLSRNYRIKRKLKKICKDNDYLLLKDLVLYFNDSQYIEVDYMMFTNKYMYVISSRSYHGAIDAFDKDDKWRLYRGRKMTFIDNPLKINNERIKIISKMLGVDKNEFINMVIINKTGKIKEVRTSFPNDYVVYEKDLARSIKEIEKSSKLEDIDSAYMEKEANLVYKHSLKCKKLLKK